MKFDHVAVLRENLEAMETPQLEELFHAELKKEQPDGPLVRMIGSILRERMPLPEIGPNIQKAWEEYRRKTQPAPKKRRPMNSFLLKAASLILVVLTLAALVPQKAEASNFFERFIAWTEDVFSLLSPAETRKQEDYVFRTDNPGLQEVYDKVTELGVTVPVVPMWLPEGYELVECVVDSTPMKSLLTARFFCGSLETVYQVNVYSSNVSSEYDKDNSEMQEYELNNVTYRIIRNKDLWVVVWAIENVECSIGIDCQEKDLNRILESIYMMEENE